MKTLYVAILAAHLTFLIIHPVDTAPPGNLVKKVPDPNVAEFLQYVSGSSGSREISLVEFTKITITKNENEPEIAVLPNIPVDTPVNSSLTSSSEISLVENAMITIRNKGTEPDTAVLPSNPVATTMSSAITRITDGRTDWNASQNKIVYQPPEGGLVSWLVYSLYGSIVACFFICMLQQLLRKYRRYLRRKILIATAVGYKNGVGSLSRGSSDPQSPSSDIIPLLRNEPTESSI